MIYNYNLPFRCKWWELFLHKDVGPLMCGKLSSSSKALFAFSFISFTLESFLLFLVLFFGGFFGPKQILAWQQHSSTRWWRGESNLLLFLSPMNIWIFVFLVDIYVCEFTVYKVYLSISILSISIVYYSFISLFWAEHDKYRCNLRTLEGHFPSLLQENCRWFLEACSSVLLDTN